MNDNMIDIIEKYLNTQHLLISRMQEIYGKFDQFLFSIPNSGSIALSGSSWNFQKHGVGIRFIDSAGIAVDAHCAIGNPNAFDAWRISTYLLSLGLESICFKSNEYMVNNGQIETILLDMLEMGLIKHDPMSDCYLMAQTNIIDL